MASVARAVRIGRGQKVDASSAVQPELFQQDEECSLYDAQQAAAAKVRHGSTSQQCRGRCRSSCARCRLWDALVNLCCNATCVQVDRSGTVAAFLDTAETLVAPIDAFFDKVFVMTEELDVRANRQALLR